MSSSHWGSTIVPQLKSKLAGERRAWNWRGYEIFATEAGSGPFVLLVHGIYAGSSSYEYRKLFPLLARHYRVVAIDLLGNGLSDRPDIVYSQQLYTDQILAAIAHFGPVCDALVASSMAGAFSFFAAAQAGANVRRLVAVAPTGLGTLDKPARPMQERIRRFVLSKGKGQVAFNLLASHASLKWFLQNQAYANPDSATREIVNDYWVATHQPGSRYVPAHFIGGALNCSVAELLPALDIPVLIAWGEAASDTAPIANAHHFIELLPHGELTTFAHSKLIPHEEEPQLFAARFESFMQRTM